MSRKVVILMILVFVFLPVFVQAAPSWWPLVPCGTSVNPTPCNQCDLLKLLKNIIDFVLMGLMPPAAAILFVWGGFLILMGGANPGWITQGKSIFWNTAMGVAIILASWLITNTIIRSLAADNVAPEWWKLQCTVTTAPPPPPGGGLCSQPAQLAASNNEPYPKKNAPELDTLISCIKSKLPGQDLGSQFTYDNSYDLCNYTRGQKTCTTSCSHAVNSCHYGGRTGSQGSLAVDFGNQAIGGKIIQAAISCGVPSVKARCENAAGKNVGCVSGSGATHVHISAISCDGN